MRWYKNPTGQRFGIESDGSQDHLIQDDWVDCEAAPTSIEPPPEEVAKLHRDQVLAAPIEFDGVLFQYDKSAKDEILQTISEAGLLGVADDKTAPWRLLDNSFRDTSLADLRQIVALGAARKEAVWMQFRAWSEGEKSTAFEVVL